MKIRLTNGRKIIDTELLKIMQSDIKRCDEAQSSNQGTYTYL